jgi:hypothetical protein
VAKEVRYAMTWLDKADRLRLIERIPKLGVRLSAVAALLEDFRPEDLRQKKETRKDMFVQREAFAYVLQRLGQRQYLPAGDVGPHLVFVDRHSDFRCYEEEYAKAWAKGWNFPSGHSLPPLREGGFLSAPAAMSAGPAMEVADLIGSVASRWAAAMAARDRGKTVPDLDELEAGMRALLPLFPQASSIRPSWRGHSLIAFRENRTGKEVIYDRIDGWARDLLAQPGGVAAERVPEW